MARYAIRRMNKRLPLSAGGIFPWPIHSLSGRSARHRGSSIYAKTAGTGEDPIAVPFGIAAGREDLNQPAESQERGTENSDQPQSRQIWTSGEGITGGWLNVRGLLR
jgi:hypothetical protein